jgi:DNA-binding NarL/FixJ family response regulator
VRSSIDCGARGYIFKHQSFEILQSALELVLAGGIYVPAEAFWAADSASQLPVEAHQPAVSALSALSPRQTAIARLLADGMSNKEIARQLDVAEGTVKAQVKSIFRKLGVRNRTEAALFASRHFTPATSMRQPADINPSETRSGDGDDLHPNLLQKVYAFRKRG